MKKLLLAGLAASAVALSAVPAQAAIGWAGNVWPLHGSNQVPTEDLTLYAQVYKGGVTDSAGQGADITAELRYSTDLDPTVKTVAMGYLGDVGNNDEYTAAIPQADLAGTSSVSATVVFTDLTDSSEFEITGDQNGNPPPLVYNIVDVLPNDVDVTFTMCMSGTATTGDPCVIGGPAVLGAWGTGVTMANVSGELYEVTVTFPAGSNPSFEYKYKADACATWESVGNRSVTLPSDGTTAVTLDPDSFNNAPLACGLGSTLSEDKVVTFQVDLPCVPTSGDVCVTGGNAALGSWSTGVTMTNVSGTLWEAQVTFAQGSPIPGSFGYKFKKDACGTWEVVDDRPLTIDESSPATQTLTHDWEDKGLASYTAGSVEVVFQADLSNSAWVVHDDPTATLELRLEGGAAPLVFGSPGLLMADDGVAPDAVAGDHIFSASAVFDPCTLKDVEYKYTVNGQYEGPGQPNRSFTLDDVAFDASGNPQVLGPDNVDTVVPTGVRDTGPARRARLLDNQPNPFNPSTNIRFELPARGEVRLDIHDAMGRLVASLTPGELGPGVHSVRWDGRNLAGEVVGSGVYYARVRSGQDGDTLKMLLLK